MKRTQEEKLKRLEEYRNKRRALNTKDLAYVLNCSQRNAQKVAQQIKQTEYEHQPNEMYAIAFEDIEVFITNQTERLKYEKRQALFELPYGAIVKWNMSPDEDRYGYKIHLLSYARADKRPTYLQELVELVAQVTKDSEQGRLQSQYVHGHITAYVDERQESREYIITPYITRQVKDGKLKEEYTKTKRRY